MAQNSQPLVSVIIPCRNEEKFIEDCLKSLADEQFYPKNKVEILVVDGMSEDGTRKKIEECHEKYKDVKIKLLNNEKKFTPYAMNIGIKEARGDIIVKADAHTQYQPNFISLLETYLNVNYYKGKKIDVVGGQIVVPSIENIKSIEKDENKQIKMRAIALCLAHPFGSASRFRIGTEKPRFVDTVFGVAYRKEILGKIKEKNGKYFNENLWRSQDFELNLRIVRKGGNILLVPLIQFKYYPKSSFREFFVHNFIDGIWAIYPFKFTKRPFKFRHYIPLIFISVLLLTLVGGFFFFWLEFIFILIFGSYLLANLFFSLKIALKEDPRYFFSLSFAFFSRHFGYGLGSLWGIIRLIK